MKRAIAIRLIVPVILAVLAAAGTLRAGDKLPLKPGLYVLEGEKCPRPGEKPAAATSVFYDGQGLAIFYDGDRTEKHTSSTITNIRQQGNVYYITQESKGDNILPGPKIKPISHSTITVKSPAAFAISDIRVGDGPPAQETLNFRFCRSQVLE